jgi:hypothetical protein
MKAKQGKARLQILGKKFIETALSTYAVIIIWKQYVKLIIHAIGIFSQCAFPKRQIPK